MNLSEPGPSLTKISVIVRFSNGSEDLWLNIDEDTTVKELKEQLRKVRKEMLSGHSLKIIYLGKILKNNTVLMRALNRQLVDRPEMLLHCSISDQINSDMEEEHEVSHGSSIAPLPLGFDRLRDVGFSEREIALLREQFMMIHGRDSQDEQTEATWQLEEDWINQTASEDISQGRDAYEDMILGATIGFIGGIFTLFFVWEPKIFYRRRQMAIIAGIMINLFFGFLRL